MNPFIPPSFIMFSSSLFTPILHSLQRGLAPIFYNNPNTHYEHKVYPMILIILGKTVNYLFKCVFKCISVVYMFSTMLLKRGCNTVDKVIRMPVEMWKTNVLIGREITCGKLYRMPWRLGVEKHHFCSDVREQSITLSPPNVNTLIYIL